MSSNDLVSPTDLRDFLKSQGWLLLEEALKDRLYVLENKKFPRRQLVFPMDISAPDYLESVDSVVGKFSVMSGLPKHSLVSKIRSVRDDTLRFRVFSDHTGNDLPLSFASTLVGSTEKLLRAAACTALRPRTHHPRMTLSEAAQFVEHARFGQTEKGSFILQVACPIHAMDVQGSPALHMVDEPFVRQVTLALQGALLELVTAIEADKLDSFIDELKHSLAPLVSSNLCEAVAEMHDGQLANSVEINFDWSMLRKPPESVNVSAITLQRDYFARIEEIRRELRTVELHEADTFIGTVERLEGEIGTDGRRSGEVVLSLLLPDEGETVRARLVLSADDYAIADRVHMTNGAYIRVTGSLRPGRQPRQLTNVTKFEFLEQ